MGRGKRKGISQADALLPFLIKLKTSVSFCLLEASHQVQAMFKDEELDSLFSWEII